MANGPRRNFWMVAAVLFLIVALGILNDRYLTTWLAKDLPATSDVITQDIRYADNACAKPGPFTSGPGDGLTLKAGSYRLFIRYRATEPGNTVTVSSDLFVNADNSVGKIFASANLPPSEGEFEYLLPLTLDRTVLDVKINTSFGGEGQFWLHNITLDYNGLYSTDYLFLALLLLAVVFALDRFLFAQALLPGETMRSRVHKLLPVFFVAALAIFMSYPYFFDFLPTAYDGPIHMTRIEGIAQGWLDGQFPVRMQPAQFVGKGYAIGMLYPDLFLWPFALLRLAGVSLLGSFQALCVSANFATAAISYYAGKRLFRNEWAGMVFAMLYTVSAYRATTLFMRSAAGESLALTFLPLFALGMYEVVLGNEKRWPLLVLAASAIFQSHILSTLIAGIAALCFLLLSIRQLRTNFSRILSLLKAVVVSLLLNLWFIVPFLFFNTQGLQV